MGRNRKHSEIGKLVNEIVSETGQTSGLDIKFEIANEDAKRILQEAKARIARQDQREKLRKSTSVKI